MDRQEMPADAMFSPLARELRALLDAGVDPSSLADRVSQIIDVMAGDIHTKQQQQQFKERLAAIQQSRRTDSNVDAKEG